MLAGAPASDVVIILEDQTTFKRVPCIAVQGECEPNAQCPKHHIRIRSLRLSIHEVNGCSRIPSKAPDPRLDLLHK